MDTILYHIKRFIPQRVFTTLNPVYHWLWAYGSALAYGFPSRKIKIVAITGTKGKTSVAELVNAILEEAGHKTALSSTLRFKIGDTSVDNTYKMSMPGRSIVQKFLRRAVRAKCEYVVMEITSQAVLTYRHRFLELDALIFTNLSPEHIEAHGSYENYVDAKLEIARRLVASHKQHKVIVVNADDAEASKFIGVNASAGGASACAVAQFTLDHAKPFVVSENGLTMTFDGMTVHSPLSGEFNIYNMLAAATYAKTQGVSTDVIVRALERFSGIRGRVERIEAGQDYTVIVDYAHTADSLEQLYKVFAHTKGRKICVLGNTGGGRDTWKRPAMARVAEQYCDEIILTNEDPYDEDPEAIVREMRDAITKKPCDVLMDRREAIASAVARASTGDTVLITGKGTDPYIMGPRNTKIPWSDAKVAREEIVKTTRTNH